MKPVAAQEVKYIVRVDGTNFFRYLREAQVYATPFPSHAAAMRYRVAFEVCLRLQKSGHPIAIVCNEVGRPVTADDVLNAQPVSEASVMEFYDDKPLATDWELMAAVSSGEQPVAIAARLGITIADLTARMSAANARFASTTAFLNKSNKDQRALTDQHNADLKARRKA
jgi:hypothetical protein